MTSRQEVKSILKNHGRTIINKYMMPKLIDIGSKSTKKLMKKIKNIDIENDENIKRIYNRIYTEMIGETIRELVEYQYKRKK